jgi:glycosyltransferase involved in cell wall biosynthesis
MGIDKGKIQVIDYPVSHPIKLDRKKSKRKLGLNVEEKILLAIGGTRFSKGLDVLLQASKIVKKKYCLVITGKEEYFKEEYIRAQAKALRHTVVIRLGELTDEEFGWYLDAADCIVLPYRKSFDGASGPMTEAVWRRKPVIAPSHGSLGDLVKKCNLGYSFESENVKDLAQKIENFLNDSAAFQWTPEAENFREKISPQTFTARYSELYESIVEND